MGKRHIQLALDSFHASQPAVGLALNVTRRPYSFAGGAKGRDTGATWLWRDGLVRVYSLLGGPLETATW